MIAFNDATLPISCLPFASEYFEAAQRWKGNNDITVNEPISVLFDLITFKHTNIVHQAENTLSIYSLGHEWGVLDTEQLLHLREFIIEHMTLEDLEKLLTSDLEVLLELEEYITCMGVLVSRCPLWEAYLPPCTHLITNSNGLVGPHVIVKRLPNLGILNVIKAAADAEYPDALLPLITNQYNSQIKHIAEANYYLDYFGMSSDLPRVRKTISNLNDAAFIHSAELSVSRIWCKGFRCHGAAERSWLFNHLNDYSRANELQAMLYEGSTHAIVGNEFINMDSGKVIDTLTQPTDVVKAIIPTGTFDNCRLLVLDGDKVHLYAPCTSLHRETQTLPVKCDNLYVVETTGRLDEVYATSNNGHIVDVLANKVLHHIHEPVYLMSGTYSHLALTEDGYVFNFKEPTLKPICRLVPVERDYVDKKDIKARIGDTTYMTGTAQPFYQVGYEQP